jgi:hypothetical protein
MALQIHAVMQKTKDVNDVPPPNSGDPEQDEVPPLSPIAGNVQRSDIGADLRALSGTDDGWAGA